MDEDDVVVEFKWPWTMLPMEAADEWIRIIESGTSRREPIYGKEIFPSARNEEQELILVDNDTDGTYEILSVQRNISGKLRFHVIETLATPRALAKRLDEYRLESLSQKKQEK